MREGEVMHLYVGTRAKWDQTLLGREGGSEIHEGLGRIIGAQELGLHGVVAKWAPGTC